MIAVSLEQTVEYFHHRHERRQLEEDLRAEAERRILLITANLKAFVILTDWDRETLQRGRAATASGGFVTFVLPDRPQFPLYSGPKMQLGRPQKCPVWLRCCRTRRSRDGTGSISMPRWRSGRMMTASKPARVSAPSPTVLGSRLIRASRCA